MYFRQSVQRDVGLWAAYEGAVREGGIRAWVEGECSLGGVVDVTRALRSSHAHLSPPTQNDFCFACNS